MGDTDTTSEVLSLHGLVYRFMQSFDEKDWALMRSCLADRLYCDYSTLKGTPPGELEAGQYVAQRQASLSALQMQHNVTNLQVEVEGARAKARCNFTIRRFAVGQAGVVEDFFHSYGHYRFGFSRGDGGWRISAITQVVIANRGNPGLHAGAKVQTRA